MDADVLPSSTAMPSDPISVQQPRPILLAQAGESSASSTSKLHVTPWPQSTLSESLKNGHVRGPASLSRAQVDAEPHPQPSRGHKRSATGEVKSSVHKTYEDRPQLPLKGLTGHSRTSSLDSTGSRIAELSAQLRARLSYAAAKVEKSRQLQQQGGVSISDLQGAKQSVNGFPGNGIVFPPELSQPHISSSEMNRATSGAHTGVVPQPSSTLQPPKLAPPVDIITGDKLKSARRRPNPNEVSGLQPHNSMSRHRRHYSEQEGKMALPAEPRWTDISQASSFTPSHSRTRTNNRSLTPLVSTNQSPMKRRTPSQNALMEKDAIETLLFMSSPENSGYHSSSRARKSSVSVSIEAQMAASAHESSQGSNRSQPNQAGAFDLFDHEAIRASIPISMASNHSIGLEAEAGDEIDRLLDQMEVDRDNNADSRLMSDGFDIGASDHRGGYEFGNARK